MKRCWRWLGRWRGSEGRGSEMGKGIYSVEPLKESWAWRGARSGVALVRRAEVKKRRRVRIIRGISIENVTVYINRQLDCVAVNESDSLYGSKPCETYEGINESGRNEKDVRVEYCESAGSKLNSSSGGWAHSVKSR